MKPAADATVLTAAATPPPAGAVAAVVMAVVGAGCTAGSSLGVAALLGAEEFGRYAFGLAWATVLLLPAALGQDRLLLREVAARREGGDWAGVRRVMTWSARVMAMVALPVLGLGLGLAWLTRADTTLHLAGLALVAVPFIVYTRAAEAVLRGLGHLVWGQVGESVLRPLAVLAGVAVLLGLGRPPSGREALVVLSAAAGLALLTVGVAAALLIPGAPAGTGSAVPPAWRSASRHLTAAGLLQVLLQRLDILLVTALAGALTTGVYAAVAPLAAFATFGLTAAGIWAGPAIAARWQRHDPAGLQAVLGHAALQGTGFALLFGAGLLPVAPWLLDRLGPAYSAGFAPLVVLLVANVVNAAAGPVVQVLLMTGHERDVVGALGLAVILMVALLAVLVPGTGVLGAAIASGVTMIAWNLGLAWQVRRRCGVRSSILWWIGRPPAERSVINGTR
jgi:O-antigen/teichoic acid export membrane protein